MLIVGTRGISELKGMFINSVSKYCLQHSPVPVVVVRPEGKIKKQKQKKLKKSSNRISGMFRLGSNNSSLSNLRSDSSDSSSSSSDEDEIIQKVNRLSVFDRIGRRSRSPSPSRPIKSKK